jgi:hypothetical protein
MLSPEEILELRPGQEVAHPLFGHGIVIEVKDYAGYGSIVIRFNDHGVKEFDTGFAKLELVWP